MKFLVKAEKELIYHRPDRQTQMAAAPVSRRHV